MCGRKDLIDTYTSERKGRMWIREIRTWGTLAIAISLGGCSDNSNSPSAAVNDPVPLSDPSFQTWAWCQLNPEECGGGGAVDPDPNAPGYWLSSTVTASACFNASVGGDRDLDGRV